jgi:hypothetical protein
MQKFNELKRRPDRSPMTNSNAGGKMASFSVSGQQSLDDIGGEPLAGSGFENQEPECGFAPAGQES